MKIYFISLIILTGLLQPTGLFQTYGHITNSLADILIPSAIAADKDAKDKTAEIEVCKKPIKLKGAPNRIESVAEMRAIIIWTQRVGQKHSEDYAVWHHAKAKSVKCKKTSGSAYYYCDLTATPCLPESKQ